MITTAKITSGYALKLPALAGKTFSFTRGVNVLFGPNGCGKTTLLEIAAAHVGCANLGWSSPVGHGLLAKTMEPYPDRFARESPGRCAAEVEWDGTPALRYRMDVPRTGTLSSDDGEMSSQLAALWGRVSSGMSVVGRINGVEAVVANPPDLLDTNRTWSIDGQQFRIVEVNDVWSQSVLDFIAYAKSRRGDSNTPGRVTVFLDEPDRSLSMPNQYALWTLTLPRLAKTCQVIVASHSPFALASPTVMVHDLEDGYAARCRELLKRCVG